MKKKIFIKSLFFFLILVLVFKINLLKNFKLIFINPEMRIVNQYGYCDNESIGYLRYLKTKYKFNSNPKIVNFVHTPQVMWAIYNPHNNQKSNFTIVLNYPGKIFKKDLIYLKDNHFEIRDAYYLGTISKQILGLKFLNTNSEIKQLNFFKSSNQGTLNLIREIKFSDKTISYPINLNINDLDIDEHKLILKIIGDKTFDASNKIQILLESIIDIDEEKIIDSYQNCYFIKNQ